MYVLGYFMSWIALQMKWARVALWSSRLPKNQKIKGSNPATVYVRFDNSRTTVAQRKSEEKINEIQKIRGRFFKV
jgi:hypothetical protein